MRKILFKAKRIDTNEWIEGNLILLDDAEEGWEAIIIPTTDSNMYTKGGARGTVSFENWHRVNKDTICRYTGLTDGGDNKIFENDIVEIAGEDGYFVIEWDNLTSSFIMANDLERFMVTFDNYFSYETCILGNTFDNPELLEEGEQE